MRDFKQNHEWLSINTATVRKSRGQDLPLTDIIEACVRRDIQAISPWRDQVAAVGLDTVSKLVKTYGLKLSGYCRGGMFPAATAAGIQAADADNRQAVDEACELNAPCLVLVVGGLPGALSDKLDPANSGALGVALDVYHVWWDPKLQQQIERAGQKRLLAFHVCDWLTPTRDLLNDRGMMGDGVIDIPKIRGWVEAQGFNGFSEVEIFSTENWWQRDHSEVLETCIARHRSAV